MLITSPQDLISKPCRISRTCTHPQAKEHLGSARCTITRVQAMSGGPVMVVVVCGDSEITGLFLSELLDPREEKQLLTPFRRHHYFHNLKVG